MRTEESKVSRRKLLGWLGVLSLFATAGAAFKTWGKNSKSPKTVKMLAQDGTLVEVDASLLAANKKRISDKELQNWVSNKQPK